MDNPYQTQIDSGFGIFVVIYMVFAVALTVITLIGLWKMYVKAGRPGWAAIIPVYNWWVWVEIIGRPGWWFWALVASVLLSWVPIVGIVLSVLMFVLYLMGCLDMAKRFGQGTGYGIGLWLLPFVFAPILGFGSARFEGNGSSHNATWQASPDTTFVPPPPAPPAAPAPMATDPEPFRMPPAPAAPALAGSADSVPPAPTDPIPSAPAAPAPTESMPTTSAETASTEAPAPAPAYAPPPDDTASPPPYTLAPPKSPVPPIGSWPPAPPKK